MGRPVEVWARAPHLPRPPARTEPSAPPPLSTPWPRPSPPLSGRSPPPAPPRPAPSHAPPCPTGPHLGLGFGVCAQAGLQLPHHHLPLPLWDGSAALVLRGHQPIEVARGQPVQVQRGQAIWGVPRRHLLSLCRLGWVTQVPEGTSPPAPGPVGRATWGEQGPGRRGWGQAREGWGDPAWKALASEGRDPWCSVGSRYVSGAISD